VIREDANRGLRVSISLSDILLKNMLFCQQKIKLAKSIGLIPITAVFVANTPVKASVTPFAVTKK
jgi:hypothetical protein